MISQLKLKINMTSLQMKLNDNVVHIVYYTYLTNANRFKTKLELINGNPQKNTRSQEWIYVVVCYKLMSGFTVMTKYSAHDQTRIKQYLNTALSLRKTRSQNNVFWWSCMSS